MAAKNQSSFPYLALLLCHFTLSQLLETACAAFQPSPPPRCHRRWRAVPPNRAVAPAAPSSRRVAYPYIRSSVSSSSSLPPTSARSSGSSSSLPLSSASSAEDTPAFPDSEVEKEKEAAATTNQSKSSSLDVDSSTPTSDDDGGGTGGVSWSSSWFPLAFESFTDKMRPTRHLLLGAPIVLWHHDDTWHAMLDQCPHRLVPLSEGRIVPESGHIECPYHGFTFDGTTGACTRVPQAEAGPSSAAGSLLPGMETRGCATALPCEVQQGIIWVHSSPLYNCLGQQSNATSTPTRMEPNTPNLEEELLRYKIEPLDEPGVLHVDYFRDLPMDWSTLVENVVDPAHLPYTHHGTISNRDKAAPVPLKIVEYGKHGFAAERNTTPPGSVEFRSPHLVVSRTSRPNSFTDWNVAYAIPTTPGKCRLLVRIVFEVSRMTFPLKYIFTVSFKYLPKFWLHLSNHKILEDDNVFLHHQGHAYRATGVDDPLAKGRCWLPTSADRAVIAFHKWRKEFFNDERWSPHTTPGAFRGLDDVLSREALIERRTAHTEHCTSCVTARRWLERMEPVLGVCALLCAIRAFGGGGRFGGGGGGAPAVRRFWEGVAAAALYALKRTVRTTLTNMERGEWPPPRNR